VVPLRTKGLVTMTIGLELLGLEASEYIEIHGQTCLECGVAARVGARNRSAASGVRRQVGCKIVIEIH
jgi:hypothetical protein